MGESVLARSGGGGGTKGPAKVDKRNQELQCPHCERVFKQVDTLSHPYLQMHIQQTVFVSGLQIVDVNSSGLG